MTSSERHSVITGYLGVALSVIAIVLSIISMQQTHVMGTREIIQILRTEDDGYYHFDGETLFKNFRVTIANNSAIPVSVVEITIERDGKAQTFEIADLPDILPLNMEAGYTTMVIIPWSIDTSEENAQSIRDILSGQNIDDELESQNSTSDIILPSKITRELSYMDFMLLPVDTPIPPGRGPSDLYDWLMVLPLSVSLCTAKNNRYILQTEDMGIPIKAEERIKTGDSYGGLVHTTISFAGEDTLIVATMQLNIMQEE